MVRYGRQHRHRGNTHTTPSWLHPNQHVWARHSVTPLAVLQEDGATIAANYGAEYCPENVSYYATPVDPSKPWTGSPKSQPIQLEDPGLNWGAAPDRVIPDMERWQAHGFCPRPGAVPKEKMLAMRSSKLSLKYWWHRVRECYMPSLSPLTYSLKRIVLMVLNHFLRFVLGQQSLRTNRERLARLTWYKAGATCV